MRDDPTDPASDRYADETHLDGTAMGGMMLDVFGRDITGGEASCGACGTRTPVGGLIAYDRPPRTVLRCPGCSSALVVIARQDGGYHLSFDELRSLFLPTAE
jgi:hypothetical protein